MTGLNDYPRDEWPDNVELLYYSYPIMVGLGTLFILAMGIAAGLLWRGRLLQARPMLWVLMLAFPFPYIATTAGWWTAELGRQPWINYGVMRTAALRRTPGYEPFVRTDTTLMARLALIVISPSIMKVDPPGIVGAARHLIQHPPIFPLENPGILSIPLGFLGAILGTFLSREPRAEARFAELSVRANTGLGAEKATPE